MVVSATKQVGDQGNVCRKKGKCKAFHEKRTRTLVRWMEEVRKTPKFPKNFPKNFPKISPKAFFKNSVKKEGVNPLVQLGKVSPSCVYQKFAPGQWKEEFDKKRVSLPTPPKTSTKFCKQV